MTHEIIEMARQAGIKRRTDEFYSEFCDGVYFDDLEAFAKLVAEKAAAKEREAWEQFYTPAPQRTERNFCSRCGKRTNDIHTCTPPQENT